MGASTRELSVAVYHDRPSWGCCCCCWSLTAGCVPRAGPEVDPRHLQTPRRSAVQTILPMVEPGTCYPGFCCYSLPSTISDGSAGWFVCRSTKYTKVRNRWYPPTAADGLRSASGQGPGRRRRVSDLSGLGHRPDELGSERRSPGGSCHVGEETVIFDRSQRWERQNDGMKIVNNAMTIWWLRIGGMV